MDLLHYALREAFGRPGRTALNALGVAIGVALVIVLFSTTLAYRKAITLPFTATATDFTVSRPGSNKTAVPSAQGVILPTADQAIKTAEVERIASLPEVKQKVTALQIWSFDPGQFKVIFGIEPNSPAIGPAIVKEWIKSGRFFKTGEKKVAVLESHFARFYSLKVGDQVTVANQKFAVIGIYEVRQGVQLSAANIYIPLSDAQVLAKVSPDTVNTISLKLKNAEHWRQAMADIRQEFPDLAITSADSAIAMSDSMLTLLNNLAWPSAGLVIIISILFIYRSLAASTWERVGEFGTSKAVGWRSRDIRNALALELFVQVALGAAAGLVLGALGAWLTGGWEIQMPQLNGNAPPLPGTAMVNGSIQLPVVFPFDLYLASFGIALVLGLLIAFMVAKKVAALKPTEAWRSL